MQKQKIKQVGVTRSEFRKNIKKYIEDVSSGKYEVYLYKGQGLWNTDRVKLTKV